MIERLEARVHLVDLLAVLRLENPARPRRRPPLHPRRWASPAEAEVAPPCAGREAGSTMTCIDSSFKQRREDLFGREPYGVGQGLGATSSHRPATENEAVHGRERKLPQLRSR